MRYRGIMKASLHILAVCLDFGDILDRGRRARHAKALDKSYHV